LPSGYRKLTAHDVDWKPRQEPGIRPSCALPYELHAEGAMSADGKLFEIALAAGSEIFGQASAGSPFHVYTPVKFHGKSELRTRAYTVAPGQRVTDTWDLAGFDDGVYHLRVCGPNGFFREFSGTAAGPQIDIHCRYLPTGDLELRAASRQKTSCTLNIDDSSYKSGKQSLRLAAGGTGSIVLRLSRSHQWYDFAVTVAGDRGYLRRFAGRVETGKPGFSDPAMA